MPWKYGSSLLCQGAYPCADAFRMKDDRKAECSPPCTPGTTLGVCASPSGHNQLQPRSSPGNCLWSYSKAVPETGLITYHQCSWEYRFLWLIICRYGWSRMVCVHVGIISLRGVNGSEPHCPGAALEGAGLRFPRPVDVLG